MTIEITPLSIIDILSIATAFMLGVLFLTSKSKNNKANVFLGLFLWSLTTEVLNSFLDGQDIKSPIIATGLLTLPLLFLYVIKTLNYRFKLWYFLLIIPFLTEFTEVVPAVFYYGFSVFLLLYILKILKKHQQKLGDFYSDTENKTLAWIKNIVYIYLFFYAFWMTEDLVGLKYEFITEYFIIASTILTLVMIYWIGYNGFSQPEIFDASILALEEKETNASVEELFNNEKTEESDQQEQVDEQNKELSSEIFQELTQKIKDDKLFLQTDVTIRSLSKQLKINEKSFSKLVKTHTQKNFYHYINQFRVEEFKRLLQTEKANHLSLLGLSEEAGFSSKSTFYSVFKTSEGMTPKQYQAQLNMSE